MKGKYYHLIMERFMLALSIICTLRFVYGWYQVGETDWMLLVFASFTLLLYYMRRRFRKRHYE